ncbi:MAG TPA: hypothetical protein VNM67_05815 [Thermoanaerobaculia bacterium]|jgi:hypothetical protein|nr:hypothetical protein [Thermoanaerobaculia bacterium]
MTFDEKLEELFQDVLRARDTYEAWWTLKSDKVRPTYVGTMNHYLGYFRIAIHSHFVAMIMALCRLYDTHKEALSIPRLVVSLQSEPGISKSIMQNVKESVAAVESSILKIKLLRDKVFGHRDRSHTYERAFEEAGLTGNEVENLIDKTLQIINALLKARNKGTYEFEHYTELDLLKLLRDLSSAQGRST